MALMQLFAMCSRLLKLCVRMYAVCRSHLCIVKCSWISGAGYIPFTCTGRTYSQKCVMQNTDEPEPGPAFRWIPRLSRLQVLKTKFKTEGIALVQVVLPSQCCGSKARDFLTSEMLDVKIASASKREISNHCFRRGVNRQISTRMANCLHDSDHFRTGACDAQGLSDLFNVALPGDV